MSNQGDHNENNVLEEKDAQDENIVRHESDVQDENIVRHESDAPGDNGAQEKRVESTPQKGGKGGKGGLMGALLRHKRFRYGTYSTVLIVAVLTVFALGNTGLEILTNTFNLNMDVTHNRLYSLSDTTKNVLDTLDQDIEIYPLYPAGQEIDLVVNILNNYAALSEHIMVQIIDPIRNPIFLKQFEESTNSIQLGSVIVTNADHTKFRVLSNYEIISYVTDSSGGQYYADAFVGENKITNAIVYIKSTNLPRICFLEGHQETTLSSVYYLRNYLEGENFEVKSITGGELSSLSKNDTLVILAPQRDASDIEREDIKAFVENNGRLIYLTDAFAPDMPNFESIFKLYGIGFNRDLAIETDTNMYYPQPNYLVPNLGTHTITTALKTNNLYAFLPNTASFTLPEREEYNVTVTPLFTTSADSYGKTNPEMTTLEFELGDNYGPLNVGVAVEDKNGTGDEDYTRIVLLGNSSFVTSSSIYTYSGNVDVFLNSVKWMQNRMETVSIVGKSLQGDRLNLRSRSQMITLVVIVVAVIPLIVLISGLTVWFRRRHL